MPTWRFVRWGGPVVGLMVAAWPGTSSAGHPWPTARDAQTLELRVSPPEGFTRVALEPGSFGAWLRRLPLKSGRPQVKLHNGALKANQEAHYAVVDIDVGDKDLQQCADAVIRLFAEYQWASGRLGDICFRYTSGDRIPYQRWRQGHRPVVRDNKVSWAKIGNVFPSYAGFRRYLENIFTYAGSASLERDLGRVLRPSRVEPGDVFIQGGFPGHAVLVVDVAENAAKDRVFLLAQSYMPAQQVHVLRNPGASSPWYAARDSGALRTPEWTFSYGDLRRFSKSGCP